MTKIDMILADEEYRSAMAKIEYFEKDRVFCRHGLNHSLDVARIAWIYCLEEKLTIDKEVVYAAALVHDIGRSAEYETGESHDAAGVRLFAPLLCKSGFSEREQEAICAAVAGHRQSHKDSTQADILSELLYKADKQSRLCFMCAARDSCYWDETKKNKTLDV